MLCRTFALAAVAVAALSAPAFAVSEKVKNACKDDYMAHCNIHEVGSEALRVCMRKAGPKLTPACVDALVEAGEVSADEVAKKRAAAGN